MNHPVDHQLFWVGMALALLAGFVVTWPVNHWLVRRGVRHHQGENYGQSQG